MPIRRDPYAKNVVVRSLSGVGEIVAALVGRSSISQLLSEGDLLRESVASDLLKIQGLMLPPLLPKHSISGVRDAVFVYLSACTYRPALRPVSGLPFTVSPRPLQFLHFRVYIWPVPAQQGQVSSGVSD
jgi:hypothetical protein